MAHPPLAVGHRAPAFALQTLGGHTVRLSTFRGKRVVLYFYPKDNTPGCTTQACGFQAELPQFAKEQTVVLGVSRDDVTSHQRFAEQWHLTFPLLSDPDAAVCKAYGVYRQKALYGRRYWGIDRTTFLISPQGRITHIFSRVKVHGHTQEVFEALRNTKPSPYARNGSSTADSRTSPSARRGGSRGASTKTLARSHHR